MQWNWKSQNLSQTRKLRDTWVWFQSGVNTDGAHNPVTSRKLEHGDILSLNTFPMISGYYTALERTLFIGEPKQREPARLGSKRPSPRIGDFLDQRGAPLAQALRLK